MSGRIWIVVWVSIGLAVVSCQRLTSAPQDSGEPSAGDSAAPSRPAIARLHGKPISADPGERSEEIVWTHLLRAYVQEQDLAVSPAEVKAYIAHYRSQLGEAPEDWRESWIKMTKTKEFRQGIEMSMQRWKVNQALYAKYGGRVCSLPQAKMYRPVEAYVKLLEHYEANGLLEICDPNLREDLHRLPKTRAWDISRDMADYVFEKYPGMRTAEDSARFQELSKMPPDAPAGAAPGEGPKPPEPPQSPPQEDVEPAEQPNFAERTFNSDLKLEVWFQETPLSEPQRVGRTPSPLPLKIPACWQWWVNAYSALTGNDCGPLFREIAEKEIPGLRDFRCEDSNMKDLAGLTKLRFLRLPSLTDDITDAGLIHLKGLTQLQVLELGSRRCVTDAGLAHLKGLTALQVLEVDSRAVTDAGLSHLQALTQLRVLDLGSTAITDAGLVHLRQMGELRQLSLRGYGITDAGLRHLGQLRKLRRLDLSSNWISEEGLAHLSGLNRLQALSVAGRGITDVALAQVRAFANLRALTLRRVRISDTGLAHLAFLTRLQSLDLRHAPITGTGLGYLKDIHSLQKLDLLYSDITDAGMARLEDLTGLRELHLRDTLITDAGLAHLKTLTDLQELDLWGTEVTDAGLVHLGALTNLRKLVLSGTDTTDAGLAHLKTLTQLESLSLSGTHVTRAGVKDLRQSLPGASISPGVPGGRVVRRRQ